MGPHSRKLLSRLTDTDLSNEAFPFATSQVVDLGYARVRASRITYVGELGFELYVPTEFVQGVFDLILEGGGADELRLCGYHAMNSLRLEKGYRHWGHDISPQDTPLEAGLNFAVAWSKREFIGRDALLRQKEKGVKRRLVQFALKDERKLLYHNEPIWRDGVLVGRITSGMFGHTLGKPLGMGYVENAKGLADQSFIESGRYEIEVAGENIPAQASLRPFYDPSNLRVRESREPRKASAAAS
jgi:4-methylaminobutanoate oxidase (formaldehyde-forming)